MQNSRPPRKTAARRFAACLAPVALSAARVAHASFLSGEALDTAADVMSWVVLVLVPIIGIVVFWIVHVMPEKIAHRSHHLQTQAIQTLCLLSLVFGGLLWPIAWLWAYTRPVAYKIAYGTDKHDEYFDELDRKIRDGEASPQEIEELRKELGTMRARGTLPPHLEALHEQVTTVPSASPAAAADATRAVELEHRSA